MSRYSQDTNSYKVTTVFTPSLCQNTLVLENVSGIMYLYVDVPKCKIQQLMLLSVLLMYLRQVFTGGVMH